MDTAFQLLSFFTIKRETHLYYSYFRKDKIFNEIRSIHNQWLNISTFCQKQGRKKHLLDATMLNSVVVREVVQGLEMDRRENISKWPRRQIIVRCCLLLSLEVIWCMTITLILNSRSSLGEKLQIQASAMWLLSYL